MSIWTDQDYNNATLMIKTLKEAGLITTADLPEKEYLHLWNTMLELQNKLKDIT